MGGDLLGIILLEFVRRAVSYIDGFLERIVACGEDSMSVCYMEKRELDQPGLNLVVNSSNSEKTRS
jgi:hypothetical protein